MVPTMKVSYIHRFHFLNFAWSPPWSCMWFMEGPHTAQVELPILQRLKAKGITSLVSLEGVDLEIPAGIRGMDNRGNFLLNRLGIAFRRWCRKQRIETPPSVWNLALIGRSDNDSKNSYPVLDSNVKAAHCKPILFFLSGVATEISTQCGCILLDDWNVLLEIFLFQNALYMGM